jgi:uncharacterized protein (TIGR01777 family)
VNVAVTGSTGTIGSAVVSALSEAGERVIRLVRSPPRDPARELRWDPERGELDAARLDALAPEAIVHLAGESVAGRWTGAKKTRIRESRVRGTRLLSTTAASLSRPPAVIVCASAVGYYGDRGDERLEEGSGPGGGFLAQVVRDWEAAAAPARERGVRVVNLRFGIVLSAEGGALRSMLTPFRLGLGARLGNGSQYMSWVALEDAVGAIRFALSNNDLEGPLNVCSPNPVTNREFTRTLGRLLGRPALLWLPRPAIQLALGRELAGELLASQRASPGRLLGTGYTFRHPGLEDALRQALAKDGSAGRPES